jgi:hypothetical protein
MLPNATSYTREVLRGYQQSWHEQLGWAHAELYHTKTKIFKEPDVAKQDRELFELLGNYFRPDSKYRKI